ncbi:MAG TPA: hypothetical protein VFX21_15120 [Acidimicrobiia bacterium]|nr:hypothetical protein [Acidimicrobiia bacterium]
MGRRQRDDALGWLRLQGRTNARLHLLARDLGARFVAPLDREAFGAVRGRLAGCDFDLHVVPDTSDTALTGVVRHSLELALARENTNARRRFSGDGLVPPNVDPARARSALEAFCFSFVSRG